MRNTSADDRSAWATYAKAARQQARLTQTELGRRLGTDRTTVWRWETGKQRPENADVVAAFAAAVGVDVDEALAAAGLRPGATAPARPAREPDEEVDLIMSANIPDAMKERMLDRLHRLREQDRQRRLDDLRWMLDQQRQDPPTPPRRGREAS